ncbi:COG6-domain-containing protein [Choiromyces venosus 120613-1]|uniref:COG6-domain-containing protein n=1 Tax=Choiromyces venosus 120613-1 TaxID=1336337 RepID=A0A3N4JDK4_9PEZI|nr:COG6-domain-containing protein [Choiromyces venosus 120613-1]
MLAWLHSTAVGEQEVLEVLFISQEGEGQNSILGGIEEGLKSEPWLEDGDGEGNEATRGGWDAKKGLMTLVDKDLQTVSKPLKSRIEQVIASHEESTLVFKISNLINFYRLTFERLLGQESSLLETMKATEQSALRQFHSSLQEHVRAVQSELPQAPEDLTPPPFLYEALNELKQLMISYDTSLIPASEREGGFSKILEEALDPYLDGCQNLSQDLEEVDKNIFVINCQLAAKATLEQFGFTTDRIARLDGVVEKQMKLLMEFQHNFFVHTSGLHPLLVGLADWDPKVCPSHFPHSSHPSYRTDKSKTTPLTQLPDFSPHALSLVSQTLDEFLPSALMDATSGLKRLSSPKIIGEITQEAASRFVDDFARVEEAVIEALVHEGDGQGDGGIEFARSVWPRTVDEVRVLLT